MKKRCAFCDAIRRLDAIDDAEADRIVLASGIGDWCQGHMRAWLALRDEAIDGKTRLYAVLKRARAT